VLRHEINAPARQAVRYFPPTLDADCADRVVGGFGGGIPHELSPADPLAIAPPA
jgi:hypothetical protein